MRLLTAAPESTALLGLAQIMRRAFDGDDLSGLSDEMTHRIADNAEDAEAMLDMSIILQLRGQHQVALQLQRQALKLRQHYTLASNPRGAGLRLLAIMAPGEIMANTPLEFLVENSDVSLELLYVGEGLPAPRQIPEHDVAFLAVCESDRNQRLLNRLTDVMRHWPQPSINSPAAISRLSRDEVSARLTHVNGVVASDAHRFERNELAELAEIDADVFPIIVRPVDSHGGHGLAKFESSSAIPRYLKSTPDAEFYVAPFVDYRSRDGKYRKYRITLIDGQPYAAHMAISRNWMVHYLNADMISNATHRAEESRFMQSFDANFGARHEPALREIHQRIELDYYSIDCAETRSGELLVFEVDSGAVVHTMDPVDMFPYKEPQMKKVCNAVRLMLYRHANTRQWRMAV